MTSGEIMVRQRFVISIWITMMCAWGAKCTLRDFVICHDDFSLNPPDGVLKRHTFSWVGFTQYIHVTTGLPHHSKAPRVVLIHPQFVTGAATDLLRLPKNYKLGNVLFGDYEREEAECGITLSQLKMGAKCPPAYLEVPIVDITPHPEFTRFGVGNSLTLVKLLRPMESGYMIPLCLPSSGERKRKRKYKVVFMVDYISSVPRDFDSERMGKKTLKLFTHKECRRHRLRSRLGSEGVTHVLCTSGCGVRPGAPIATQNIHGQFELVGIAAGGAPCSRRSMRRRLNDEPPIYIDVYPYVTWITNVITAFVFPKPYPQNFALMEGGARFGVKKAFMRKRWPQRDGWKSRTWVTGNFCFRSMKKQKEASIFYSEKFVVNADPPGKIHLFMKISAGIQTTIACAKLILPNRLMIPTVKGVGGYNISVSFTTDWFPFVFYYSLGLLGRNSTDRDMADWYSERSPGYW